MKKISVLLIAFLLVASFAFAEETFTFSASGEASVIFGIDLEENTTGFSNDNDITLTVTFVPDQRLSSEGSDWYGDIELRVHARGQNAAYQAPNLGVTRARITNDVVYVNILVPGDTQTSAANVFSAADAVIGTGFGTLSYGQFAETFTSAITGVTPGFEFVTNAAGDRGGITIGFSDGAINDLSLAIVSDGSWVDNVENYYGVALNADVTVDIITITNKLFLGVFAEETQFANTTSLGVSLEDSGTDVTVGFDLLGSTDENQDLIWKASLTLGQELAEGTSVSLRTTVGQVPIVGEDPELGLDVGLTFVEGTADGLVPGVGAKLGVVLMNVLGAEDTMSLGLLFDVEYSEGGINPFANVGFHTVLADDDAAYLAYELGLSLTSDFHGIDNTAFTLRYGTWDPTRATTDFGVAIDDLHTGFLTLQTTISF